MPKLENGNWLTAKTKNLFKGKNYTFYLRNMVTCFKKVGCSGFIQNNVNGKIVYINTETWMGKVMYRTAKNLKDYTGGMNRWCKPELFAENVNALLENIEDIK